LISHLLFFSTIFTHPSDTPTIESDEGRLESEEEQESHHETEKPHSLGQSEAQNGVGEELLLERRVPCVADDEGAEDGADTGAGSGNAHRGSAGADVLGRRVNVQRPGRRLEGSGGAEASVARNGQRAARAASATSAAGATRAARASSLRTDDGSGSRVTGQRRPGDGGDEGSGSGKHDE